MRFNIIGMGVFLTPLVVYATMTFVASANADEWEGEWVDNCKKVGSSISLSKSIFDLSVIEMQCTPLGSRKLGSRYIVDLSCDGEGGAERMRAQIEVQNNELKISGIGAHLGTLHRCASDKPK